MQASLAPAPTSSAAPHRSAYTSSAPTGAQADADYALALRLQQDEDEAARRYTPNDLGAGQQAGAPQTTLQGAVLPGAVPPAPIPVHTHQGAVPPRGGGYVMGALPVNEGPRRFSGARQSGPVYTDPNPHQGGYSSGGHGGGRSRPATSSDSSCSIM